MKFSPFLVPTLPIIEASSFQTYFKCIPSNCSPNPHTDSHPSDEPYQRAKFYRVLLIYQTLDRLTGELATFD